MHRTSVSTASSDCSISQASFLASQTLQCNNVSSISWGGGQFIDVKAEQMMGEAGASSIVLMIILHDGKELYEGTAGRWEGKR